MKVEIENKHKRMLKNGVFEAVPRSEIPHGNRAIDSMWACKKKSNGILRGRLNARYFKQINRTHYDSSSIHAPVTNAVTIRIVMILMLMTEWVASVVDVKGVFLHGEFTDDEDIFMEVPRGFEKHYTSNVVLKLLRTIYGLKQAVMALWKQLLKCMLDMGMTRCCADPCLYYTWTALILVILVT